MHTIIKSFEWVTRTTSSTCCFSPARRLLLLLSLIVIGVTGTKAQSDVKFNDGVRYSQWVIDSRMNEFYANTTKCGFAVYDQNGKQTADLVDKKGKLDYVVGLVAKSIIEASQYYSQFTWAQSFAKPWFLSIQNYGNKFYSGVATSGGSLDDLNAVKLYLPLRELTKPGGTFEDNTTYSNTATALNKAITGLNAHNTKYRIKDENILAKNAGHDVLGGWWHKSIYENQMWLDGAYMGPALFAELVNYSGTTTNIDSSNDWDLIVKQFTILRNMCWNPTDKLLYHAFAADGGTNETSHSNTWEGLSHEDPYVFHSASYWGRAVGWYFLALVDILEQMDKANLSSSTGYTTLKGYLKEIADGLVTRQDKATGGWYQILDKTDAYSASSYNGKSYTTTKNYIESSATALFTAAYLKAIRLGYLEENAEIDYKTVAVNGYKCLVNQFFSVDENGKVNIFGSCRSAGLGGNEALNAAGKEKFRDGSKAYYLLGKDVAMVKKSEKITEGKVLGAFILAATEYERQYQKKYSMLLSKDLNSKYTLSSNESISAEVLGEGTATYQWHNANTTPTAIDGATSASYTPTKSGKYYCKITVTPTTAAKTRGASTEPYTITTSTADVTVAAAATTYTVTFNAGSNGTCSTTSIKQASANASINLPSVTANTGYTFDGWYTAQTGGTKIGGAGETYTPTDNITLYAHYTATGGDTSNGVIATFKNATATTWEASEKNGFSISNVTMKSGTVYVKLASKNTITITIPSGYTVTGLNINALCTSSNTNSELTFKNGETSLGTVTISSGQSLGDYNCTLSNNVKGATNITITNSGSKEININTIQVLGYSGTPSTPTTYTVTATAENGNGNVTITDSNGTTITSGSQVKHGTSLTFTATANEGYEFSGWTVTGTTGTADGATYTIASLEAETAVTATFTETSSGGGGTATYYSYKVEKAGLTAPGINTSKYITDSKGKKLVKMTFGGWKWNEGNYSIVRTETNEEPKVCADSWKNSTSEQNVASIDDHLYWFEGTQDAVEESKAVSENEIYGRKRYGWFVSPTRVDGKTTESHPFTLPVRGSFMTFEPTQNGTLSIYILQNGAWNTDKSGTYTDTETGEKIDYNKGDIAAGEFRPHAFHVVNQRGLTVQEFSPKYSVETRQTVTTQDYYCMFTTDKDYTETKYKDPHNVARWTEFKDYMSPAEQQRCHDNWKGEDGAQKIIELDNGSFLAVQKGIVKYTFHVTGNETYYFFSNFSKMGFSGARFTPDEAQPQPQDKVAEGQISTLELSDVIAYDKITPTENGTIAGTNLKNYTYKIGDKEIAPVAGVSIPQFYSITLDRTFKAGQWTTLTLPFNLTEEEVQKIFGDGTQIIMLDKATLSSEGGARLHFIYHEIQNVLPGYPYLIKPTLTDIPNDAKVEVIKENNTITSFTVYGKCINPFISQFEVNTTPYTFKGTPGYCTADKTNNGKTGYSVNYAKNDIFVSDSDGKLYVSGGASYGKGYRAWLKKKPGTMGVKSISVVMSSFSDDDDTTTSIDVAEMAPDLIEALGIQTGVYNLSGQRVANDTRNLKAGIYIVNGKKTVVR